MKYDVGDRIGSYQLLCLCGEGAYGRVFLARNVLTQHQVALKLLPLSAKVTARELQGLKNYRECRHPNLLQIHHIDQAEGVLYYTMDAADNLAGTGGGYEPDTLAARLAHRKSLPAGEVAKMAAELLEGLDCLRLALDTTAPGGKVLCTVWLGGDGAPLYAEFSQDSRVVLTARLLSFTSE